MESDAKDGCACLQVTDVNTLPPTLVTSVARLAPREVASLNTETAMMRVSDKFQCTKHQHLPPAVATLKPVPTAPVTSLIILSTIRNRVKIN